MERKPWLKFYDPGVPHSLEPYPQKTPIDIMRESTALKPDETVMIFEGSRISNQVLEGESNALAAALIDLGVQKGDRVFFFLPRVPA